MTAQPFKPTCQQQSVIHHMRSAFVDACPGAGKTRVMVERARHVFQNLPPGRGIAFLSFTRTAIFELETRLRNASLLPTPVFPNFIGTFDSFVWQFLVAPFGVDGVEAAPRLLPDLAELTVSPYNGAHPLPLFCFCRATNTIYADVAKRHGFDVSKKQPADIQRYATAATKLRSSLKENGRLDYNDVRDIANLRLASAEISDRIAGALKSRFCEIIVDEAQDCNPDDLEIIAWLRNANIPVKIVCDPLQSIYEFRGGVTDHLYEFKDSFDSTDRLKLTGNFRSAPNICKAIAQLRPLSVRGTPDDSLGPTMDVNLPVHVLSYQGAVTASIGLKFSSLVSEAGIEITDSPIVAATRDSGAIAAGQPKPSNSNHRSVRLARAVTDFHFAAGFNDIKKSLESLHRILLEIEGHVSAGDYHDYLADNEIEKDDWQPRVISILRALRYDTTRFQTAREWLEAAKKLLDGELIITDGRSISQKLVWKDAVAGELACVQAGAAMPRTIHSVKGCEFPAVCVITTTRTFKGILEFLTTGASADKAEEARKIYVAASRAEKLLVFAAPKSQAERLVKHLRGQGAEVVLTSL